MVFPIAAAHMVLIPSETPRLVSMASPATIRIALSMNPNPTKGKPVVRATKRRVLRDGFSTSFAVLWDRRAPLAFFCADLFRRIFVAEDAVLVDLMFVRIRLAALCCNV